jgi:hypothetical protein
VEAAGQRRIGHNSRADVFRIWAIGDIHFGTKACALKRFKELVADIAADPFSFWVGMGDYADFISPTDKRFDARIVDGLSIADLGDLGHRLMEEVRDLLTPIKSKGLGLVRGNHEDKYMKAKEQAGLHGWLCTELGLPNLEYSALFDILFSRADSFETPQLTTIDETRDADASVRTFRVLVHHGAGYAQTGGGKLNKLEHFMQTFDADIHMIAHIHDQLARRLTALGADGQCRKLIERTRVGIVTGPYLRTYAQGVTTYGEVKAYRPTPIGSRYIEVRPWEKDPAKRLSAQV